MKFITTAPDRRTLVKAIAEHTGMEPTYIGPPTFNYTVGTITIDREGYVDVPDEQAADLKAFLIAKGWMEPEPEPEQPRIQIGVPAKDLTVANVTNLIYMLYSKQYLLGKAVGTACVRIEDAVITLLQEYTPENLEAYAELLRDYPDRLDRLISELSSYMESTGRSYQNHAATIRRWAENDKAKGVPKQGIPDYTCKEGESL